MVVVGRGLVVAVMAVLLEGAVMVVMVVLVGRDGDGVGVFFPFGDGGVFLYRSLHFSCRSGGGRGSGVVVVVF